MLPLQTQDGEGKEDQGHGDRAGIRHCDECRRARGADAHVRAARECSKPDEDVGSVYPVELSIAALYRSPG